MASVNSWKSAVSADWSIAADWSLGSVPNDAAGANVLLNAAGSYTVSIASGESFSVASIVVSGGTLGLVGSLVIGGASSLGAGAAITGSGLLYGNGSLVSGGVILGNTSGAFLQIGMGGFTNQGTVQARFGNVFITSANFSNLSGNVLTGGVYEVDGPASGSVASILTNIGAGAISEVKTDAATITLNGFATAFSGSSGNNVYVNIEASLTSIAAGGVLNLLGGRGYSGSTTLANSGVLTLGGGSFSALGFSSSGVVRGFGTIVAGLADSGTVEAAGGVLIDQAGISDAGTLLVDANAVLAITGSFAQPITDNGILQAEGGLLQLSGSIGGGGSFVIDSPSGAGALAASTGTLELNTPVSASVAFNGPGGVLKLDAPGSFSGSIVGFGQGDFSGRTPDTIDLAGIVGNSATLVGSTLQIKNNGSTVTSLNLSGSYTGAGISFTAAGDGAGGTDVTVGGIFARDYNFEGPYWHTKTITWSYATSNIAGDGASFSNFMTTGTLPGDSRSQGVYQAVVQQALATWAGYAGFNFVQVADGATADLRFGWGNFSGGSEIGQAAYSYQSDVMLPDTIIRLQDPTVQALDSSTLIGGLVYHGASSSLYQVAVHEIGHSLGLAHSTDIDAVMYPQAAGAQNQSPDASDIAGIQTLYAAVACFAAGTRIATERGEVTVERLRVGDVVQGLASGLRRRVRWIGQRGLDTARHARPQDVQPVCIAAGAFGPGRPLRPLRLSPDHAVLIAGGEGGLVPIRYLVNGASVRQERVRRVVYFHVELEDLAGCAVHDALAAEGLEVESYLDTGNRHAFEGAAAMQLHPRFSGEGKAGFAPLHLAGDVVAAGRRLLLARASALGHVVEHDPDLRLLGPQGARVAFDRNEHTWRFHAPAGRVRLTSRSAMSSSTIPICGCWDRKARGWRSTATSIPGGFMRRRGGCG